MMPTMRPRRSVRPISLPLLLLAALIAAGGAAACDGGAQERPDEPRTVQHGGPADSAPHEAGPRPPESREASPPAGREGAGTGSAPARLELTPEQMAAARFAFGVVVRRPAGGTLEATAVIEPAPKRYAQLGARVAGRVTDVRVAEGDSVRAGQTLVIIDSPELGQATGDYLAAFASADVARSIAERERALYERQISSEREWRLAEAEAIRTRAAKEVAENRLHALGLSEADVRRLQIEKHFASLVNVRTPMGGVVATRSAAIGQIVQPGESLVGVVDPREVAIAVDIYEQAISQVRPGQSVEVRTTTTGDRVFRGRVRTVGAVVEPRSRTVKLRVDLPNPDGVLRPGMFATVRVLGVRPAVAGGDRARPDSALYVPSAAVQRDGDTAVVFVKVGPRAFEPRVVQAAGEEDGFTRVVQGVAPGDTVVTTGSFALKSELRRSELGEKE